MSETFCQKKQHHAGLILWVLALCIAVVVVVLIQREQNRVSEARRQELVLRDSLIQADVAAVIIDEHQKMIFVTPAVAQLTGYSTVELINRPLDILMPVAYREVHNTARARADANPAAFAGKHQVYCQVRRKDGTNVPVMASIVGSYAKGGWLSFHLRR